MIRLLLPLGIAALGIAYYWLRTDAEREAWKRTRRPRRRLSDTLRADGVPVDDATEFDADWRRAA